MVCVRAQVCSPLFGELLQILELAAEDGIARISPRDFNQTRAPCV